MQFLRAYKFRIYSDMKRRKEIDKRLIIAQQLYNNILEKTKKEYKKDEKSKINKFTLNKYMKEAIAENEEFLKLYPHTLQEIFVRPQEGAVVKELRTIKHILCRMQ